MTLQFNLYMMEKMDDVLPMWYMYLCLAECPVCVRPSSGVGCTSERETAVQQSGQRHRWALLVSW